MQVTHYSGYSLTQARLLLFLQSPLHDAFYNISREGWGDNVRGREVSDVNEGGFILGNVSPSPGVSAALALV